MSMCNVVLQTTAGYLMADAGRWAADGELIGLQPKLCVFPTVNAAMVTRGIGGMSPDWWGWKQVASQDDLMRRLPEYANAIKARTSERYPDRPSDLEVTLVRWDAQSSRPVAAQLFTAEPGDDLEGYAAVLHKEGGYQPNTWLELPDLVIMPTIDAWQPGWPSPQNLKDERRFVVRRWAPAVVAAQRARPPDQPWKSGATVAGWVDMAAVTSEGVTVERVIEWPDQPARAAAA